MKKTALPAGSAVFFGYRYIFRENLENYPHHWKRSGHYVQTRKNAVSSCGGGAAQSSVRGAAALTDLTVTDNLGGYDFNGTTVYPLTYEAGSIAQFTNGVPQAAPAVVVGPTLVISGITVPAGGDVVLVYQAQANEYADPAVGGTIDNTVTVTGDGLSAPITATETVTAETQPALTVSKSITPAQVVDNDRVTYIFVIQNTGNQAVVATDNAAITDTFDPILTALTVTFDGVSWTQGVQYNYNEATGLFTTVPGQILVPAATYVQDPVTGVYNATPGIATLVVTGTI